MFNLSKSRGHETPPERRRTRADNKIKLEIKHYSYTAMKKNPYWRGVWEWDGLDAEVQKSDTVSKFVSETKGKQHRPHII